MPGTSTGRMGSGRRGGSAAARMAALLVLLGPALWAGGCAPSLRTQGRAALDAGQTTQAVRLLRVATAAAPKEAAARNDLGIACFHAANDTCAIAQLRRADRLGGIDGEGLSCLGRAYERTGSPDTALAVYSRYSQVGRLSPHRREMVRRVRELARASVARNDMVGAEIPPNSLAVLRLKTVTGNEELKPIGSGLTEWMMTDLQYVRALRVLERMRTDAILQELALGETDAVDQSTAPRLGRLLKAQKIVSGNVLDLGQGRIRVDLFAVVTGGGSPDVSVSAEGPVADFFGIEKRLVFDLLAHMGIAISPLERVQISRVPTQSLASFLAYSHGVEQEWAGNDAEAENSFQQAGAIDPTFDQFGQVPPGETPDRREETVDQVGGGSWPEDPADDRITPPEAETPIPGPPELPAGGSWITDPPSQPPASQTLGGSQ